MPKVCHTAEALGPEEAGLRLRQASKAPSWQSAALRAVRWIGGKTAGSEPSLERWVGVPSPYFASAVAMGVAPSAKQ